MVLDESKFLLGGYEHGIRSGGGQPVAVLARMIDVERVCVVLDYSDLVAALLEFGDDLFQQGGFAFRGVLLLPPKVVNWDGVGQG